MKREQITARIPADIKEWLQEEADRLGISMNEVIIMVLRKAMEEE